MFAKSNVFVFIATNGLRKPNFFCDLQVVRWENCPEVMFSTLTKEKQLLIWNSLLAFKNLLPNSISIKYKYTIEITIEITKKGCYNKMNGEKERVVGHFEISCDHRRDASGLRLLFKLLDFTLVNLDDLRERSRSWEEIECSPFRNFQVKDKSLRLGSFVCTSGANSYWFMITIRPGFTFGMLYRE